MISLFTLAANETTSGSVYFLNNIFGTVGSVLTGAGPALLGKMFQVFNTSVLALGSLIVTYTTVVSILATAHEGEALGKKFHTMWIPVRTVMGIAALVPTSSGYSYLQIALMWFIIQGVGAADTLWTTVVNYVASGYATKGSSPGTADKTLEMQFGELFQSLVCQSAAKAKYGSGYFCFDNASDSFCTANDILSLTAGSQLGTDSNGNVIYNMGPSGTCGNLTLGDSSTLGQAKTQAFSQIIPTLSALADQFIAVDYAYNNFVNSTAPIALPPPWIVQYCSDKGLSGPQCIPTAFSSYPAPSPTNKDASAVTIKDLYWKYGMAPTAGGDFLATASNLYIGVVGSAMTGTNTNPLSEVKQTAIDNGWIYAGGYFYYIAKANNQISNNVGKISVSTPTIASLPTTTEQALTTASVTLVAHVSSLAPSSNNLGGASTSCGNWKYGGNPACDAILNGWVSALSGSSGSSFTENPVISAQKEGNTILTAIEIVVPFLIAMNVGFGIAGGIYLGVGVGTAAAITLVQSIIPIATFFIVVFLGVGLTLAVYTPMIPYMLFTFGAINWLIATIETMIAAPIVAIGLLHPEGGHDIWGRAEKALELLLNIFLRPSLMIFGMIGGMLMSFTVVMMINYAFLNVVNMVSPNSNLLEMIFFMVIYTSLFTTSMNKCFDLIHLVPDKILRWIGGGAEQFGEGGGLEKVGQAFEGGSQKAGGAAEGGVKGGKAMGAEGTGAAQGDLKARHEAKYGTDAGFKGIGGKKTPPAP